MSTQATDALLAQNLLQPLEHNLTFLFRPDRDPQGAFTTQLIPPKTHNYLLLRRQSEVHLLSSDVIRFGEVLAEDLNEHKVGVRSTEDRTDALNLRQSLEQEGPVRDEGLFVLLESLDSGWGQGGEGERGSRGGDVVWCFCV